MLLGIKEAGAAPKARRVPVEADLSGEGGINARYEIERAAWLWDSEGAASEPAFCRFRLKLKPQKGLLKFQVSADQFFWLYLNGHVIARGPDVSPPWSYGFAEYAVEAPAGELTLEAFVWWMGDHAPNLRMTTGYPGFALAGLGPDARELSTGSANWEVAKVQGYGPEPDQPQGKVLATGDNCKIDASSYYAEETRWREPVNRGSLAWDNRWGVRRSDRVLAPTPLPEMPLEQVAPGRIAAARNSLLGDSPVEESDLGHASLDSVQALLSAQGEGILLPGNSRMTLIWDLEDYWSGYPDMVFTRGRGAAVKTFWLESLYETREQGTRKKGKRDQILGKYATEGLGDRYFLDGQEGQRFVPIWWRSGRYCVIQIETADEPLSFDRLGLLSSGYPFDWAGKFTCDQSDYLDPILKASRRTLEVSTWDAYQDSPYYEQLMYVGDTRLELLMTYSNARGSDLPRRVMELYESSSQQWNGLVAARFPSRSAQLICTFSMVWVWLVRDFLLWKGEPKFSRALLPGVRYSMDRFSLWEGEDGLLVDVPGWPFVDWVDEWQAGRPESAVSGVSALVNLFYLYALQAAEECEQLLGRAPLGQVYASKAESLRKAIRERFWCDSTSAIKDDDSGQQWSMQAQVLGTLTGVLSSSEGASAMQLAKGEERFSRASYMFRHYYFEALAHLGLGGRIVEELGDWKEMVDRGSCTVWESLEPTRSDCHAWSGHPIFHMRCSVAGVRPAALGFSRVRIAPQPGKLRFVETTVPHPCGDVSLELHFAQGGCEGWICLPEGIGGVFVWNGRQIELESGRQLIELPA